MMRGGHAGAACAFLPEVSHKDNIKLAARFARTYASVNTSQEHMLQWYCRQLLWNEVMALISATCPIATRCGCVAVLKP